MESLSALRVAAAAGNDEATARPFAWPGPAHQVGHEGNSPYAVRVMDARDLGFLPDGNRLVSVSLDSLRR